MNFIDFVFFVYMFIGIYLTSLFFIIYFYNRKVLFYYPKARIEPVSIVIPCYNGEKKIGRTIESILSLNYPREKIEIIVVDDKSSDDTAGVVKSYANKYKNVKLIINKRNSGGAAEPTNIGIKAAKYKYVAVADDDSFPEKDILLKMLGFLQKDEKTAAVTSSVLAEKPGNFMQKLQAIEYVIICFNRKLLDCIDSVYVTPGPFSVYKKDALMRAGLFDRKNLTQDIEIVWRLLSKGYKAKMSLAAKVYTDTPRRFKQWWKQRVRWNIGGTQTLIKYKGLVFKKGMLGNFIIPFFSLSLFLGIFGLGFFMYLFFRKFIVSYMLTKYSLYGGTVLFSLQELSFAPSILNFFGAALFFLGLGLIFFGIGEIKEENVKNKNFFKILIYNLVYLVVYPFIMVTSLYKIATGRYSW